MHGMQVRIGLTLALSLLAALAGLYLSGYITLLLLRLVASLFHEPPNRHLRDVAADRHSRSAALIVGLNRRKASFPGG